jgi:ubiquinone biosynthesis monooxygenase Coq7
VSWSEEDEGGKSKRRGPKDVKKAALGPSNARVAPATLSGSAYERIMNDGSFTHVDLHRATAFLSRPLFYSTMASATRCTRLLARSASRSLQRDFLAPAATSSASSARQTSRAQSTTSHLPSPPPQAVAPLAPSSPKVSQDAQSKTNKPIRPLSDEQRHFLSSALRVNQTGELAAILIYAAQNPVIVRSHPHLRPLMKHMYDQEAGHYKYFNEVLSKHRIRPTAMTPVWTAAASFLGWSTAVLGREAAMACTEAVETEIGTHYNEQVRVLLDWAKKTEERGETLGPELDKLLVELRRIRDEELEHLDHAVENDAKQAKPYELLNEVVRGGCRGAIWVSERV